MNEVNIVVAQRVCGTLEVLYCGSARGASAAIVLRQVYCSGVYRRALWCRADGDGFVMLWSWCATEEK